MENNGGEAWSEEAPERSNHVKHGWQHAPVEETACAKAQGVRMNLCSGLNVKQLCYSSDLLFSIFPYIFTLSSVGIPTSRTLRSQTNPVL